MTSSAAKLPKETYDFPVFRDYQDDVFAAVEELAATRIGEAMTIAGKQEREQASADLQQRIQANFAKG